MARSPRIPDCSSVSDSATFPPCSRHREDFPRAGDGPPRFRPHRLATFATLAFLLSGAVGWSTPPEYTTFGRTQRLDYSPRPEDLLRIWVAFVEQGDGLLIQLPEKYNYDPSGGSQRSERIDILVDGGSNPASASGKMRAFIRALYGGETPRIEHAVITHHDSDHVAGLTHLLEQGDTSFEVVHHNGLASYRRGKHGFPASGKPSRAGVFEFKGGLVTRGMALLNDAGALDPAFLLDDLQSLRKAYEGDELQGVYEDLASGLLDSQSHGKLQSFQRAYEGAPFIAEWEAKRGRSIQGISVEPLWPLKEIQPYASNEWSQTINGNSVTFRLSYGDFQMLFTGDQNKHSEKAFLEHLKKTNREQMLDCDVLKVPHHGSGLAYEDFFRRGARGPIISVASMGNEGFESKSINHNSSAWQHPSTDVIQWLGGAHRFYSTFVHEQKFSYADIDSEAKRQKLIERKHILIETDGQWFRVVEVDTEKGDPRTPPSVMATARGDGTRWIRAREN